MASTKLTLSSDEDTVQLAKRIASESNISVSKLFKKLIIEFSKKEKRRDPLFERHAQMEISDDIKALSGILKGKYPDDMDYKNMKYEYLKDKHGL
jgi:hypothetical protein